MDKHVSKLVHCTYRNDTDIDVMKLPESYNALEWK